MHAIDAVHVMLPRCLRAPKVLILGVCAPLITLCDAF